MSTCFYHDTIFIFSKPQKFYDQKLSSCLITQIHLLVNINMVPGMLSEMLAEPLHKKSASRKEECIVSERSDSWLLYLLNTPKMEKSRLFPKHKPLIWHGQSGRKRMAETKPADCTIAKQLHQNEGKNGKILIMKGQSNTKGKVKNHEKLPIYTWLNLATFVFDVLPLIAFLLDVEFWRSDKWRLFSSPTFQHRNGVVNVGPLS